MCQLGANGGSLRVYWVDFTGESEYNISIKHKGVYMNGSDSKKYYVYEWFIEDTGDVFYVGKGSGNRFRTRKRENKFFTDIIKTHNCCVRKVKENLSEDIAFEEEKKLIAHYRNNTNYRLTNIADGGQQPPIYCGEESHSKLPEVRKKISESNKKLWEDESYRDKMKKAFKSYYQTPEGRATAKERYKKIFDNEEKKEKARAKMLETVRTEEFKNKKSNIMKEAYSSESVKEKVRGSNNGNSRRIGQYDLSGNLIREFDTLTEADNETGFSFKNISKALHGHRKTAYGYIWKFLDNKRIVYSKREPYVKDVTRDRKAILQYDKDGNFLKEYESVQQATKENNFKNHSNIIANLKGRTKHAYGYVWKYKQ